MELLNHDLAHEFPQLVGKMRSMKISSARFLHLFNEYDELNHAIGQLEQDGLPISDERFEEMKKRRLKVKDDIYQMLIAK
ncbi:YdcH family protein [Variovorax sp. HJSM1_2]|uniref:YdcH family protein n=1 Tax=Variovorax sp. HJSM1_2 TaxID=3366263 RepID=UPI003BEAA0FE